MEINMKQIIIKKGTLKDIDGLVSLLKQLFSIEKAFTFNPQAHKRGLHLFLKDCDSHRVLYTAWAGQRIVGMVSAQTRISTASGTMAAVIEDLVVDSTCRGRGVGSRLLESVEQWAKTSGICHLSLLADMENHPALKFYTVNGWEQTQMRMLKKVL